MLNRSNTVHGLENFTLANLLEDVLVSRLSSH